MYQALVDHNYTIINCTALPLFFQTSQFVYTGEVSTNTSKNGGSTGNSPHYWPVVAFHITPKLTW